MDNPVFVLGSARSGTKLLYSILLSTNEFPIYRTESHILDVCRPKYGKLNKDRNFRRFFDDWIQSKQFHRSNLNAEDFKNIAESNRESYFHFLKCFMEELAARQNKSRWVEKTPAHLHYVFELSQFFPDAKFLHIIRDGRDVAISRRKEQWTGTTSNNPLYQLISSAAKWKYDVTRGMSLGRHVGRNYKEIFYEDLMNEPHKTVDLINSHLYTNICVDESNNRIVFNEKVNLNKDSMQRWKRELASSELVALDAVIGTSLKRLGYSPSFDHNKIGKMVRYKLFAHKEYLGLGMKRFLKDNTALGRFINSSLESNLH